MNRIEKLILEFVQGKNLDFDYSTFPDGDFHLIFQGGIDSLDFIELMCYLETHLKREIDLSELDPDEYVTFKGMVKCLMKK